MVREYQMGEKPISSPPLKNGIPNVECVPRRQHLISLFPLLQQRYETGLNDSFVCHKLQRETDDPSIGIYPFSAECKEQDLKTLAGLDEYGTQFVRQTKLHVERHSKLPSNTTIWPNTDTWSVCSTKFTGKAPSQTRVTDQGVILGKSWTKLRESNDYENDFYYISQLFEENWMPQATI
jgi:hypothetical protein